MKIIEGIAVCGSPIDENALKQIVNCRRFVEGAALNADHHYGYSIPIGGVLWSQELISPSAVGFDIGCGNKAVRTDLNASDIRDNMPQIMDDVASKISFGMGRSANWDIDHPLFDSETWYLIRGYGHHDDALKGLRDKARAQLGTVGSGNHYVDIFADEEDRVWVGVHFGSRGLGHKLATYFLEASGMHSNNMDSDPVMLHQRSDLGEQYIKCMNLAGEYAYAGRDAVCTKVVEILGANMVQEVHNHHNFAWREKAKDGYDYWVMRKGATPCYPGQQSFVGATMAEPSYIIEGVEGVESADLFYSTVHGAGRVMSRGAATGHVNRKTGELTLNEDGTVKRAPRVTREMMDEKVAAAKVELRGANVDEAPQCYKRLPEVLAEQGKTVKVLHTLTPMGVAMAGKDIFDPYKD
ncbi:MAG TPA: RtcB family protein [Fimbriimonadaceae bacterium]|jgi:tRNA-splicing ligase RtcB